MRLPIRTAMSPLELVQHRCELLEETMQVLNRGTLHRPTGASVDIASLRAYEAHARFLKALPRMPCQIDRELAQAAVMCAVRSIRRLPSWDHGAGAVADWDSTKSQLIGSFGLQDKHAWAAERRHNPEPGIRQSGRIMFEQSLPHEADYYLDRVLRYVTG
jgi:hypothetical protein